MHALYIYIRHSDAPRPACIPANVNDSKFAPSRGPWTSPVLQGMSPVLVLQWTLAVLQYQTIASERHECCNGRRKWCKRRWIAMQDLDCKFNVNDMDTGFAAVDNSSASIMDVALAYIVFDSIPCRTAILIWTSAAAALTLTCAAHLQVDRSLQ